MFVSSRAIVLNKVKHTDHTFILTLYTEAEGSVAFAARMPRSLSLKSRAASHKPHLLQPLTIVTAEWDHRPTQQLQHLKDIQAHAVPQFGNIAISGNLIAEALYHALKEEHQGDIFTFIHSSLATATDNGRQTAASDENFPVVFLLKLARHLGIAPHIPHPSRQTRDTYFDLINAEYTATLPQHKYYLLPYDARHIPLMLHLDYSTMHLLSLTPAERHRALRVIAAYYRLHLPNFPQLHSLDILRKMI